MLDIVAAEDRAPAKVDGVQWRHQSWGNASLPGSATDQQVQAPRCGNTKLTSQAFCAVEVTTWDWLEGGLVTRVDGLLDS